jgi:hypothetical protein
MGAGNPAHNGDARRIARFLSDGPQAMERMVIPTGIEPVFQP